jgi:hypothetical protein
MAGATPAIFCYICKLLVLRVKKALSGKQTLSRGQKIRESSKMNTVAFVPMLIRYARSFVIAVICVIVKNHVYMI